MKNEASYRVRAPVLITSDQIKSVYALVEEIVHQNNSVGNFLTDSIQTTLTLKDGERYTVHSVEDVFQVPNKKKNPISRIKIRSQGHGSRSISIDLKGEQWKNEGAEIEITGAVSENRDALEKFYNIFEVEKDLFHSSIRFWYLVGTIYGVAFAYSTGFYSTSTWQALLRAARNKEILETIWIFWAFLFSPIAIFLSLAAQAKSWMGGAIYLWDDGKIAYEKKRKIILFFIYTIPVAVITKFVAGTLLKYKGVQAGEVDWRPIETIPEDFYAM